MKRKRDEPSDSSSSQIRPEEIPLPNSRSPTPGGPATPTPLSRTLPLTSVNLRQLPGSPPKSPSIDGMSHLPSQSNQSSKNYSSRDVQRFLSWHGMNVTTEPEEYDRHVNLVRLVNEVLNMPTQADMRPESAEKIARKIRLNEFRGETKFFEDFWIRINHSSHPIQLDEYRGKWETEEWDIPGLDNQPDTLFRVGGVSALEPKDPIDHAILNDIPNKIQTPKPDQTFGVAKKVFDEYEMEMNGAPTINKWAEVSPGIYHPFFVVEFKGSKGEMLAAMNQALRAASTLVECYRSMRAKALMQDLRQPGADTATFVFSLCIDTEAARLFVNWANVRDDGKTRYKMTMLRHSSLWDAEALKRLRQDIGRVLYWGTGPRLNGKGGVRDMLKTFHDHPDRLTANGPVTLPNAEASDKPGKSNKAGSQGQTSYKAPSTRSGANKQGGNNQE
ncbi:MAG: hypothetical protein LQ348_004461 [Seirophora lacunosa]|nr:MAG: hypothetical protein LQ348_004461 [Seirophora lacunosa]